LSIVDLWLRELALTQVRRASTDLKKNAATFIAAFFISVIALASEAATTGLS
jgi:hypothetical protein